MFFTGESATNFALFENADQQEFIDTSSKVPVTVQCPSFGRSAKLIADVPFTRVGANPSSMLTRCARRGSRVLMLVELIKPRDAAVEGTLTVTPRLRDRAGRTVPSALKAATVSFKADLKGTFFAVDVDLGLLPDLVGLIVLELGFSATPGKMRFDFTPVTTQQFVLCTHDDPFDPTPDSRVPASDTVSGTPHRMGKLMSLLPSPTSDVEDILWRLHVGINESTPPHFFNMLGIEITHNGDVKRHFDGTAVQGTGVALPLIEQWLMWAQTPANRAACAGYVQLLRTMAATLGIEVRRRLVLPCTRQLPPTKPGDPMPKPLPMSDVMVEAQIVIADAGVDAVRFLKHVDLIGPDGVTHSAHPALMESSLSGEFFEACAVTPLGKFLPGGFTIARLKSTGVPNWDKGPSGRLTGGGFTKAQRGFDSALDVVRWWSNTKTASGFQRFMCWVLIERGVLRFCWDVEGKVFEAKDVEQIRNSGKQLPPP